MLIDKGASHSFISYAFASALGLELAQLSSLICVESPVGGQTILRQGCRGCDIRLLVINYLLHLY